MLWYTRNEVVSRTEAICVAGLTDNDLATLCYKFANHFAQPAKSGTISTFMPMCQPVCYHACSAVDAQDRDGFENCRDVSCADTTCAQFLLRYNLPT